MEVVQRPELGILAVSIAGAWQFTGYVMALYLAGLRGISSDLREAAMIDGCNTFNLYRRVIIPLLKPVTFTAIVLTGMGSIRVFDLPGGARHRRRLRRGRDGLLPVHRSRSRRSTTRSAPRSPER